MGSLSLPINLNTKLKGGDNVLDPIPHRDVVSWTSSIARFCQNGHLSQAAATFSLFNSSNIQPNSVTLAVLLSGCADFPSQPPTFGLSLHGYLFKSGLDASQVVLGTALIDMYAKSGLMDSARKVFDQMRERNSRTFNTLIDGYVRNGDVGMATLVFNSMPKRDKISWTALIGGFVKNGMFEEALQCFREMQMERVDPDYVTIIMVLTACANLGALAQGMWVHRYSSHQDFSENTRVCNSLIDMYVRCGCVELGRQVFDSMPNRTSVSWNSIIVGFAINGHAGDALEHFSLMEKVGLKPDSVTFTGALTACSHAGLVNEGVAYYEKMRKVYGISPRIEHFGCMVDLLSRDGRLEDALKLVESMPMKPNEVILGSLLAACRIHGNVALAERLMGYLVELEPECDSNYVLLSNIYAAVGKWDGVGEVRKMMKERGIRKRPGVSSIEIDNNVHEFVAGDNSHFNSKDIHALLEHLTHDLRLHGYTPEMHVPLTPEND